MFGRLFVELTPVSLLTCSFGRSGKVAFGSEIGENQRLYRHTYLIEGLNRRGTALSSADQRV
jgi:hypothetical protein